MMDVWEVIGVLNLGYSLGIIMAGIMVYFSDREDRKKKGK